MEEWQSQQSNMHVNEGLPLIIQPPINAHPTESLLPEDNSTVVERKNISQLALLGLTCFVSISAFNQANTAFFYSYLQLGFFDPAFYFRFGISVGFLILGYLSDLYGRKKFILISLCLQILGVGISLLFSLVFDAQDAFPGEIYNCILGLTIGKPSSPFYYPL